MEIMDKYVQAGEALAEKENDVRHLTKQVRGKYHYSKIFTFAVYLIVISYYTYTIHIDTCMYTRIMYLCCTSTGKPGWA